MFQIEGLQTQLMLIELCAVRIGKETCQTDELGCIRNKVKWGHIRIQDMSPTIYFQ
jgi:hypothetical protein